MSTLHSQQTNTPSNTKRIEGVEFKWDLISTNDPKASKSEYVSAHETQSIMKELENTYKDFYEALTEIEGLGYRNFTRETHQAVITEANLLIEGWNQLDPQERSQRRFSQKVAKSYDTSLSKLTTQKTPSYFAWKLHTTIYAASALERFNGEYAPSNIGTPRPTDITVDWIFKGDNTQVSAAIPFPFDGKKKLHVGVYYYGSGAQAQAVEVKNDLEEIAAVLNSVRYPESDEDDDEWLSFFQA